MREEDGSGALDIPGTEVSLPFLLAFAIGLLVGLMLL